MRRLLDMFGPLKNYPNMPSYDLIDGKEPPMLLLGGQATPFGGKVNG